ncbi:uncharacterized protein LOC129898686 [Solanum dulcamara]|uniref:uncharacterized protein LOC129898686 n=1 Tax=Solanum dulcamara TaxID=45834 RepID=UPI002484E1FF|nr:uncharacterized protein LOC129898686 [Solanum dulcamara]XP_055829289.1 uncharacterized protein LOC129898686 [Solanum dulcamara]
MEDSTSLDAILEFLRKNKFTGAEAALRGELNKCSDLNDVVEKLTLEDEELSRSLEANGGKATVENLVLACRNGGEVSKETSLRNSGETSKELIVKEIECGIGRNGSDCKLKNVAYVGKKEHNESVGTYNKTFSACNNAEDTMIDMYSWSNSPSKGSLVSYQNNGGTSAAKDFSGLVHNPSNGSLVLHQSNGGSSAAKDFSGLVHSGKLRLNSSEVLDSGKSHAKSGEDVSFSGEKRMSCSGSTSKNNVEPKHGSQNSELKKANQQIKLNGTSRDVIITNPRSKSDELTNLSLEPWKDSSAETVFPLPKGDVSTSYDHNIGTGGNKVGKRITENGVRNTIKEQVDEVGRAFYLGKTPGSEPKDFSCLGISIISECQKEELPRLPPVRIKSEEKSFNIHWEEKFERDGPGSKIANGDNTYVIGSFLDVPIGQELTNSGGKRIGGGSWLSVSQGIAEDTSELVSGFATIGDGLSEGVEFPNEYWDSDEYDDDDDVGYTRQPIEDESWFLAHEIDYPSDNEKETGHGSVPDPQRGENKEDDEQSFAEEDSYLSGERYFQSKNVDAVGPSDDPVVLCETEMYRRTNMGAQYDRQLMDEEELNLMCVEPVWQGFVTQTSELAMLGDDRALNECERPRLDDIYVDGDQHGSVRSIGVGINSDTADISSEVHESFVGGNAQGDIGYFHDHDASIGGTRHIPPDSDKPYSEMRNRDEKTAKQRSDKFVSGTDKGGSVQTNHLHGGFSFALPRDGQLIHTSSSKSLCSSKGNTIITDEAHDSLIANDDMLGSLRPKSSESSPSKSSRDESNKIAVGSAKSSPSSLSNYGYVEREHVKKEEGTQIARARVENLGQSLEDEEAVAVQEQVKQIMAQEEEFETFELKIVHRKNRTGFEEDKSFQVVLNSVIAGRYQVTEYLGSAAFSKAVQAHDLHTGMDVCVKIIKNNKDFFDQSLDEIKLLKFVNKHDPADKYHLLRLYDYFYYREHLLIVCELLKANLYEFQKFNRESGGEVYFTMPRLQSITIQCLEALQFLHGLGLIHCDLKPENILVKSYSRCEVKVIDLGSSCFETDHLCSYVQSRSYRAPEVILGLPYDKKIDIWSLGCILAELCTGNVLFQNDSPATLLARVLGITGPIDQEMLVKGRDTHKYFTKNHMLYERNQETNRMEYLIPKKTSLRYRLPMGDQGFVDFVAHLLEVNPKKRPSALEALKHPWLSYPYEPISS